MSAASSQRSRSGSKAKKEQGSNGTRGPARRAQIPVAPAPFRNGLHGSHLEDVQLADINLLDRTFQYRLVVGIEDLKDSLRHSGQREPVDLVGPKPYRIVDGFCRVGSIQELGWSTVKALIHPGLSQEDAHGLAFAKNVIRKNLSPIDKAHAIYKARERKRTTDQIAECFRLSDRQVLRYEALLSLPQVIQDLLADHRLSMAHASVLASFDSPDPESWARRCQEGRWSASQLKRELRKTMGRPAGGRSRSYIRKDGELLRVYPFRISRTAPPAERQRIIETLKEAIAFLEKA